MSIELQACSNYSFLRGASHVEELFAQAALFGYNALAITDQNTLAGMARAHQRAAEVGVRLIVGCRLDLACGSSLLVYPKDRPAYARLCRLLSLGKSRAGKGACELHWADVFAHAEGLVGVLLPDQADAALLASLQAMRATFGDRAYLALTLRRRPGDAPRLQALSQVAWSARVPTVVTGDVLYHTPARRRLQDVMTCIREGCTIDDAGFRRERFADRHLQPPEEVARRFRHFPEAVARTGEIADRCRFSLAELRYQYPQEEVVPGLTAQQALERHSWEGAARRYPEGVPARVETQIRHELGLIESLGYAPYFLTVHSIVGYARSRGILCQGRGSAANSAVCFVLGITSIDPMRSNLLFERFISAERREPPDIDVDFEHEWREEVIQWIYDTYGRDRAALCCTVSRYRSRGAIREVGKALGLPEDVTAALAGQVWGWSNEGVGEAEIARLGLNAADQRLRLAIELASELIGFPRHLSQHPGGFVLTEDRLDELVPIEPAAMADRQVIEWDKDDIDTLNFMKVDVLGLGMLGCMRRAFDLLREHNGIMLDMATIPPEDPATYAMIRRADTLGVFQIESRAQMAMLPRLKPRTFYDLVIEVAIVRPGPIQGDMVHPYLRRRDGLEPVEYPTEALREVLGPTLGVPLFQEQAMKVAIVCAGFSPGEADQLRRSMATFKVTGGVSHFREKLIEGMVRRGYTPEFAERTFRQIEGFGSYGFPESHAASFALIAYASSWMKCHHPDVFACALLNAQPMGFYAPAQIVRDAVEHGVEVRAVSVNDSAWDCTLEGEGAAVSEPRHGERSEAIQGLRTHLPCGPWIASPAARNDGRKAVPKARHGERSEAIQELRTSPAARNGAKKAIRLGLRMAKGLAEKDAARILANRHSPYTSIGDLQDRTGLNPQALEHLAEADAFACLGISRRDALWQVRALPPTELPLFARRETIAEPPTRLMPMTLGREVVEDYRAIGLTLRRHPVSFLREELKATRIVTAKELATLRDGARLSVAGIVLVRQKPGSAKGVLFMTIEDETGHANLVIWPSLFDQQRRLILSASMVACRGRLQRVGEVIHMVAEKLTDYSELLRTVGDREEFPHRTGRGDEARHGGAPDPRGIAVRTRDFR